MTGRHRIFVTRTRSRALQDGYEMAGGSNISGKDLPYLAFILILIAIMFFRVVLNPDGLIYSAESDIVDQFYPWRLVADRAINNGTVPYWNPYNYAGEPLLANMQLAYYYPVNMILFTALPVQSAFGFSFMFHLLMAGCAVFMISRRLGLDRIPSLISAEILIFSGYYMGHIYSGHYGQVCSASWIPVILLLFMITVEKKKIQWGLALGAAVGIQFLAGHIQISIFSVYMMLIYYIMHIISIRKELRSPVVIARNIFPSLIGAITALAIASLQIIPSLQYTDQSTRSGGVSYGFATGYSIPPWNIITALVPGFFGDPVSGNYWNMWNYWELNFYIGIPTLVLLALSVRYWKEVRLRFFLVLGGISIALAMGRYLPFYWFLWRFVPVFDIIRVPSRFILLTILSASILTGFGAQYLLGNLDEKDRKKWMGRSRSMIRATVVIVIISLVIFLLFDRIGEISIWMVRNFTSDVASVSEAKSIRGSAIGGIVRGLLLLSMFIAMTAVFLKWRTLKTRSGRYHGPALVILVFFNLLIVNVGFMESRDLSDVYPESGYIDFLKENSGGYRIYDEGEVIRDNHEIVHGLSIIKGYNPLELDYYHKLVSTVRSLDSDSEFPVLDLLGVRYIITRRTDVESHHLQLVYREGDVSIYENPDPLPFAFVANSFTVEDDDRSIELIESEDFDPRQKALISQGSGDLEGRSSNMTMETFINITNFGNNRIDMEVSPDEESILVISQSYYPEWKVFVDGEERALLRAFHGLSAVHLYQGQHEVRFEYVNSFGA